MHLLWSIECVRHLSDLSNLCIFVLIFRFVQKDEGCQQEVRIYFPTEFPVTFDRAKGQQICPISLQLVYSSDSLL